MNIKKNLIFLSILLSGCASLVPADPQEAKAKLASDLGIQKTAIQSVRACVFAVAPTYVKRAEFLECAYVETEKAAYIARAIKDQQRFEKTLTLPYASLGGFTLQTWGIGVSQVQLFNGAYIISFHIKSGGKESIDLPAETDKIVAVLRAKGVRELASQGKTLPIVDGGAVPIFIPVRK